MGRTIRRVPSNWEHPKAIMTNFYLNKGYLTKEKFRPMFQEDYNSAVEDWKKDLSEWLRACEEWEKGFYLNWEGKKEKREVAIRRWLEHIEEEITEHGFSEDFRQEERIKYETGICSYTDIAGEPPSYPNPEYYMPEGDWYQLFETVSEGTPLSPPFETPEELIDWLSHNKDYWDNIWTKEQAENMLKVNSAPSMVVIDGKILNSQESLSEI